MPKRKISQEEKPAKRQKATPKKCHSDSVKKVSEKQSFVKGAISWPEADVLELLSRIEANLPENDSLSYSSRLGRLSWENIAFKSYSMDECKNVWSKLCKQVRKYRVLNELVKDAKELVLKSKPKMYKHPDKPKHPLNSFMIFYDEHYPGLKEDNPHLNRLEISKIAGRMFKELSSDERKKYDEMRKAASQEYSEKLENFYANNPELIPGEKIEKKLVKNQKGPPQKPKNPFMLFKETERPDMALEDCREEWDDLDDKTKFFWIKWANDLYLKYLDDMNEYKKTHPHYVPKKSFHTLSRNERKILADFSGRPKPPPRSVYHLFSKMIVQAGDFEKMTNQEVLLYVSDRWRKCTEVEKEEYKVRLDQLWEEYFQKMDSYIQTLPPDEKEQILKDEKTRNKKRSQLTRTKKFEKSEKPEALPSSVYKYFLKFYDGEKNPVKVWDRMSEEEKDAYRTQFEAAKKAYILQYENYLRGLSRTELEKISAKMTKHESSSSDSEY